MNPRIQDWWVKPVETEQTGSSYWSCDVSRIAYKERKFRKLLLALCYFETFVALLLVSVLAASMAPPPALSCEDLIELLEIQRGTFTNVIQPLRAVQKARLTKANDLISKAILNDKQRKARDIFITLRDHICYEVFLLCALATTPSGLMFSKLGDYHGKVITWWTGAEHPQGLRDLAPLRMKTPAASFDQVLGLQSRSIRCTL